MQSVFLLKILVLVPHQYITSFLVLSSQLPRSQLRYLAILELQVVSSISLLVWDFKALCPESQGSNLKPDPGSVFSSFCPTMCWPSLVCCGILTLCQALRTEQGQGPGKRLALGGENFKHLGINDVVQRPPH